MASFVLVLSATGSASAELIAHWTFDEGSGTTAFDSSGNGHDGTFNGDPTWAAGHLDGALQLDGSGDYLTCGLIDIDTAVTGGLTVCAWINKPAGGDMKFCSNRQGNNAAGGGFTCTIYNDRMEMDLTNASVRNLNRDTDGPTVPADTWVHVSWVYDDVANTFNEYHDGVLADSSTENVSVGISTQEFRIGADAPNLGRYVNGLLDDLRIYNSALSEQEILGVMQGGGVSYPFASRPSPSDGALLEATWANLGWRAGDSAISHNLYFGTNFDDVNESAEGTFVGNLATTNQVVGFAGFPAPDGLQPGTTYYWRIDEVNDANAASPWRGDVWSFWVPPRTAYEPDPADGTSFVMTDATLSWTPGFGATLQYVYFGDDFDDVSSATGTLPQTDSTFAPAALEGDKTYYWRVDEFDGPATHKGDVWSFTTVPEIAVANPNLMLWWTLDEGDGATAVDWSGHGNHGAIVGGAMWIDGYQGTALTFGEDVYVEAAGYDGITGTVPRTCCAWIRTTTANRNIMSWGQNVAGQKWRMRVDATGGLRIEVNGGYHYGVTNIADGRWHHVAVTFADDGSPDALDTLLYVDGQPDATSASLDEPINTAAGPVRIGESPWHNAPFLGEIDDARIYDKVLTAEEIQQVMLGDMKMAGSPVPDRAALVDIRDISALSWSAGDTAASHDVYFGTNREAVAGADNNAPEFQGNQVETSLSLTGLVEFGGGDYYWRIDEVEADGSAHAGTIWKFKVPDYLIVDNLESYDNIDPAPGEPGTNRIFDKWIDGFGTLTNGALVGNDLPPYAERTIVHGGAQSMIYRYDNAGKTSEATLTVAKRDWTAEGVTKLSLWLRGASANAVDRIYVALNGTAAVYQDDPAATQLSSWTEWVIDLSAFGVGLTNVNSITIGIGTKGSPAAGGTGTMYFDDIRLVR